MVVLKFPKGFLWGTATSAHQVEGFNTNSDWWEWEKISGHIKNNDTSEIACDWWKGKRYREDFNRAKSLHQNAHRFSIEWPRIEPKPGKFNKKAIEHYRDMLEELRKRKMTPMITLNHFTIPIWFAKQGGWENEKSIHLFKRYVTYVVEELKDLCNLWITINEPTSYFNNSYIDCVWPPGKKNIPLAFRVLGNLIQAHGIAYHAIHDSQPNAKVGIALHFRRIEPYNPSSRLDRLAASLRDYIANRLVLNAITEGKLPFPIGLNENIPNLYNTFDFIGLNYYFSERVRFDAFQPLNLFAKIIKINWIPYKNPKGLWSGEVNPNAFYRFIKELSVYNKPIYITENGIFDYGTEENRIKYLVGHLKAVHKAIKEGSPVKGYFYWTLVDNFEWAEGYEARFGLYALDVKTQKRIQKKSAKIYAKICENNEIEKRLISK